MPSVWQCGTDASENMVAVATDAPAAQHQHDQLLTYAQCFVSDKPLTQSANADEFSASCVGKMTSLSFAKLARR